MAKFLTRARERKKDRKEEKEKKKKRVNSGTYKYHDTNIFEMKPRKANLGTQFFKYLLMDRVCYVCFCKLSARPNLCVRRRRRRRKKTAVIVRSCP